MRLTTYLRASLGEHALEGEGISAAQRWLRSQESSARGGGASTGAGNAQLLPTEWGSDLLWTDILFSSATLPSGSSDSSGDDDKSDLDDEGAPFASLSPPPPSAVSRSDRPAGGAVGSTVSADAVTSAEPLRPDADADAATWLLRQCVLLAAQPGAHMPAAALARSVLGIVKGGGGAEAELQGHLFDLLGEAGVDLMGAILQRRAQLAAVSSDRLEALALAGQEAANGYSGFGGGSGGGGFDGGGSGGFAGGDGGGGG
ncbi:unnamed protein product, partial [Phaeothamnion confervicola]